MSDGRWAPGIGRVSPTQERALFELVDGDRFGWCPWPNVTERTLRILERLGIVELTAARARLTEEGRDIVGRWIEGEAA